MEKDSIKEEMNRVLERLAPEQAQKALAFARALAERNPPPAPQKTGAGGRQKGSARARLVQLRERVRQNPERWTVDAMAESLSLARSRFFVLYKAAFGQSPDKEKREFLNQKALALLSQTDKAVQKIAKECGYNECENFIRAFRKRNGMSPLQYRKRPEAFLE